LEKEMQMHSLNDKKKKFDRENNLAQKVEVSNRKVRFVFSIRLQTFRENQINLNFGQLTFANYQV
jgi:hypothetical protein